MTEEALGELSLNYPNDIILAGQAGGLESKAVRASNHCGVTA
jgi:hypothetical protein